MSKLDHAGLLFVTAAGNGAENLDDTASFYPAASTSTSDAVLVVGASSQEGRRLAFSNYGRNYVSLFAPGILIATTTAGQKSVVV